MHTKRRNLIYFLFLLPSLAGVMLFYFIPFITAFYYSLIDNMVKRNFVGIQNYANLFSNELFGMASKNSIMFILVTVPTGMILAFLITSALKRTKRGKLVFLFLLLIPLVIPSGTMIFFWHSVFDVNGVINTLRYKAGLSVVDWANNSTSFAIIVIIFLWKNISYSIVLFWSGISRIPDSYYEACQVEGGGSLDAFKHVTWVYLAPTTFVVLIMAIVNSFKVFKEIYMLYGGYPSASIYMLQHYMNNQFVSMNMQKLSSAAYLMFLVLGVILLVIFEFQKKVTDSFKDR